MRAWPVLILCCVASCTLADPQNGPEPSSKKETPTAKETAPQDKPQVKPEDKPAEETKDKTASIDTTTRDTMQPSPWDFPPPAVTSKTIDWLDISTDEGTTYLGGPIVVDKIFRQDADDVFTVNIRLKNKLDSSFSGEFRIEFTDIDGKLLLGHNRTWLSFIVPPLDVAVVTNTSVVQGAVGFRLFVRRKGDSGEGLSDVRVKPEPKPVTEAPAKVKPKSKPTTEEPTTTEQPIKRKPADASSAGKCAGCGKQLPEDFRFCPYCGKVTRD